MRLVLSDGSPLLPAWVAGHGPDLRLVVDQDWYRLDLDDVGAPGSH